MAALFGRIFNRLRPRDGWAPFLLTLVALLCLPAALIQQGNGAEGASMIPLAVLALFLGFRLARSRLSARSAAIVGGLLGLLLAVLAVGRILPPLSLLWNEAGYAFAWLKDWLQGEIAWPLPFSTALVFAWQRASTLGTRLWWWGQAVAGDAQTQDRIVLQLLTAYLVWAASLFATWQIYRRRSALLGLAPAGIIIAIVAFFSGDMAFFYLAIYLFCTLWLVAVCRLRTQTEHWDRQGTDYPDSLGLELTISYGPWLVMVMVLATLFPVVYPHRLHQGFWRVAEGPWERVVSGAERFIGPIDDGYPGGPGYGPGEGGELPSAHLLTGGPELSDTPVLYVSTSDPAPTPQEPGQPDRPLPVYPRRYWRSKTYDTYTGQGWTNSPLKSQALSSNQPLPIKLSPGSEPSVGLVQQFQRLSPGETLLYAANEPYLSDSPLQAWERAPGDLAFLTGEDATYSILSYPPAPTVIALQASSLITEPLQPHIADRYLALPDTVPQRVLDLALDVAGDAPTLYDRALAIEHYLRAYPYTLDLPDPPAGRDLVDYFLFEQQEGYCDYYASAMVVMARGVGVPARLASGYAQGTYDQDARRWVVTERDGHSWVEVFFEGIGWVEFEPTAGQPALDRPGGQEIADISLPPLPSPTLPWWQAVPWGLVGIVSIALLLGAIIVWIWRPRPALSAAELIRDRQARLLNWGARLGHSLQEGQTALEYGQSLGQALRSRGRRARWSRARLSGQEASHAVERLTDAFVRAQYSPGPIDDWEGWRIRDEWTRLRRHLWALWLALGFRKTGEHNAPPGASSTEEE
jgi:transglutaminase-like putative cysteine protease